jgi:glutamine synthetase
MAITIDDVLNIARTSPVHLVRFLFCDTSSIIRGKTTHVDRLRERLEGGIGLVKGTMAMNLLDQLQLDTGLGATGEVRITPDLSTFTMLPYATDSALLLCDLLELDRTPWTHCTRSILKRNIAEGVKQGFILRAAFEPEFMLGSMGDGQFEPIDRGLCFSTESMNKGDKFITLFSSALTKQKLEVEQYYPELGHGQHELSVMHAPALQAADQHILYRETLRGVANQLEVEATLAPKPFADQPGNGCHLHLSAWNVDCTENLFYKEGGLSDFGKNFVAGLLDHLPALLALTCSSVNSYRRLQPKAWSSAFVCWGYENREAAVRVPTVYWGHEQATTNLEIKCVDSSCNPYLALSGVIAAGLDGVRRKLEPPEPVEIEPGTFNEQVGEERYKRLPLTLKDALIELERDDVLVNAIGSEMIKTFVLVKQSEQAAFAGRSPEFEMQSHRTKF